MTKDVLINEPRVVSASFELCKWFVQDKDVYEITKEYMKGVCLRNDIYDVMIWQLACASTDAIAGEGDEEDQCPVRMSMQQLGFDLMAQAEFLETCKQQFVYQTLANTFTLGIYGMVTPVATTPVQID